MTRHDIATELASIRLLRGAGQAFFDNLAQQPRTRHTVETGKPVFAAGEPADAVYAAIPTESGANAPRSVVELTLPTGERSGQLHVEHITGGDVFGEFEFVASGLSETLQVRRSSARTLAPCMLYRIPLKALAPLLAADETIRSRLIKLSFDRLISALNVKATHLTGDRDAAFANWLLDTVETLGIAEGRHVRFSRTISQREIADALGVTRETMSLRLNEWERAGLLNTGGQSQRLEILDYPRVALRAAAHDAAPPATIDSAVSEIDGDVNRGELVRARNIALDMLAPFPASPDLRHRLALASIRAGNNREALAALAQGGFLTGGDISLLRERVRRGLRRPDITPERLFFGDPDQVDIDRHADDLGDVEARTRVLVEDIAAIEARAEKELAFSATEPGERVRHATAAAETYANIHELTGGTYAGINAAMMWRIAGKAEKAGALAAHLLERIDDGRSGYWAKATRAEALLLAGDAEEAREALAAAHTEDDASDGHRHTTRLQLNRLATSAGVDVTSLLAAIPVGATAVFSGPLFRGASQNDAEQAELETQIRAPVRDALSAHGIRYIYGALACGADIVVAEEALAAGAELHVVLPFPADAFLGASVSIGNPPDAPDRWTDRYWTCLRRASSLTTLVERPPDTRALDFHFFHAFKLAAGMALLRADALTARSVMLSVDDQRKARTVAGAARATQEWATLDQPLVSIPIAIDRSRDTPAGRQTQIDTFRSVVFLWPSEEDVDLSPLIDVAARANEAPLQTVARHARDRRSGVALTMDTLEKAIAALSALQQAISRGNYPVRILADFGPAADSRGRPADNAISRLAGASDMPGFPLATAIVSRVFAARARAENMPGLHFVPISRTTGDDKDERALASREMYRVDFR